jgi:hypothetical protein
MRASCPAHLTRLSCTLTIFGEDYKLLVMQFSPPSCHLRLGPDILSTLFSDIVDLCSSLKVSELFFAAAQNDRKNSTALCVLKFAFFDSRPRG